MNDSINYHQSLPQPYRELDEIRDLSRLSADISYADKALIKSICPKKGILNQMTQTFFEAVTTNLRNHGIKYYSPEHEQYFVELITRGCAFIKSVKPPIAGNVYGSAPSTCAGVTGSIEQLDDSQTETHQRESRCTSQEGNKCRQGCDGSDGEQVSQHGEVIFENLITLEEFKVKLNQ